MHALAGPGALLLASVLLVLSAAATTALLRPGGRLDRAVTFGVLCVVLAAGCVLVVGAAGALGPAPLIAVHAVLALVPAALLFRTGRPRVSFRLRVGPRELRAAPWATALVTLAATALGWQLVVALALPPYAFDALTYHLTTVATWVRNEDLAPTTLSLCCAYYPLNAELVTAWPVVLLGSDLLVGTVQVLAAVLAAVAVAGIGRTVGLRRAGATSAGALFLLTPAVLAQAPTAYVDVLLVALVLAALHGLARFAADARLSLLVVPGLCAGLLFGTKGTGALWAGALVVTTGVLLGLHVRRRRVLRMQAAGAMASVLATVLLLGGWWYVRSALDTGNPLYPFEVRIAGWTLFPGPTGIADVLTQPDAGGGRPWPVAVLRSWSVDLLPWRLGSYDYQQRAGGLGPLWVWLGLPLLVLLSVRLWRRRGPALAVALPVAAVLLVQPYRWWARFTLALAALGAVAVVAAVEDLRPGAPRRVLQGAALALAAGGAGLVLLEVDPAARARPVPAPRVLELVVAPGEERTVGRLFFPEYRFLNDVPVDATIVVDLRAEPVRFVYPLFGRHLTRTVLPAGDGPVPDTAWVVTAAGRPLDVRLARDRPAPHADVRGVRVWAPLR